jgi:hypothetical protein
MAARDRKKPLWRCRRRVAVCRGVWWEDGTVKFVSAGINNATHSRALTKERQHNNVECTYYDRGDEGVSIYVKIMVICELEAKIQE